MRASHRRAVPPRLSAPRRPSVRAPTRPAPFRRHRPLPIFSARAVAANAPGEAWAAPARVDTGRALRGAEWRVVRLRLFAPRRPCERAPTRRPSFRRRRPRPHFSATAVAPPAPGEARAAPARVHTQRALRLQRFRHRHPLAPNRRVAPTGLRARRANRGRVFPCVAKWQKSELCGRLTPPSQAGTFPRSLLLVRQGGPCGRWQGEFLLKIPIWGWERSSVSIKDTVLDTPDLTAISWVW